MKWFAMEDEKKTRAREIAYYLLKQLQDEPISVGEAMCAIEILGGMVEHLAMDKKL